MNLFKACYCRVFQIAFRIALPVLPYRDPEILRHLDEIPALLSREKLSRPLLVTDATIRGLGLTKSLEEQLTACEKPAAVYDGTRPNPTTDMVMAALALYHAQACDCIIAFGGGSPMDCAKAVGALVARPKKKLKKMAGILKVMHRTPPIIAIPTTAGTGSETTLAAVIVDHETRHKYVINDFSLIPRFAVLDASVIHSLPAPVAATTGMDALTHAVEAYIGRSTTTHTRTDAEEAVRLIFAHIEKATAHESAASEAAMMQASHLAGRAFTRSYVGYVHAVSHSLSGKYDLPHGLTNAILLPHVLEMYGEKAHKKLARLAICTGLGTREAPDAVLAERFIQAIHQLNQRLGIPTQIDGIQASDIPSLAAYADKEANPLYPVPVLWDRKQLMQVYTKAQGHQHIHAKETMS